MSEVKAFDADFVKSLKPLIDQYNELLIKESHEEKKARLIELEILIYGEAISERERQDYQANIDKVMKHLGIPVDKEKKDE